MFTITEYLAAHEREIVAQLLELVKFKSISADSDFHADCDAAAQWLVQHFQNIGFSAELYPIPEKHAIVFAQSPYIANAPTLLIYGHYDVQPVEPLNEWKIPDPFQPVEEDGVIIARGVSDDKGPFFAHIVAAEYWMQSENRPKLNVKFLLEGDEEGGNERTEAFVRKYSEMLSCDYLALSDTPQFEPGQPAITVGLRGIVSYELRLFGPQQDIHSGMFGGAVTNPCSVLTKILASMKDENQRITIPNFYDDVFRLSPEANSALKLLPFNETQFFGNLGLTEGTGEKDMSVLERIWTRPTFDINGLTGGYQGEGGKTIIPAWASAKLSFRLVPNQNPREITASLEKKIREQIPPGIRMEFKVESEAAGMSVDITKPCMKAAARAIEFGFGRSPFFIREGGSIPIVSTFAEILTPNIMMIGLSQKSDNAHGPNEHFALIDFLRGIRTSAKLWQELAALEM